MPTARAVVFQPGMHLFYEPSLSFVYHDTWKTGFAVPLIISFASATLLLLQILYYRLFVQSELKEVAKASVREGLSIDQDASNGLVAKIRATAKEHGGSVIFSFKVARLLGCLALVCLYAAGTVANRDRTHGLGLDDIFHRETFADVAVGVTFVYSAVLAVLSLIPGNLSRLITRHNIVVLLVTFGVYAYRDIWPLGTYSDGPKDIAEGPLLWIKIAVLTISAVIIPLFIPRQYIPVDPQNPMESPNPEQTASIISLLLYTFLDPIVFEASKVAHLQHERLPALADTDYSKNLTEKAFPHVDPFISKKKQHIFFGVMRVFFWEYVSMGIAIITMVIASFASPVALNRILSSLESSAENDYIRPWVWIAALFFGPFFVSISFQWYIFIGTRVLARVRGIFIELVFEHSLRIRFKAESSVEKDRTTSRPATPAETSEARAEENANDADGNESVASESTAATADKGKAKAAEALPAPADAKKKDNLVGKINTLVTVDVDNVTGAKDFLMLFLQTPLELILATIFLYAVLGWSAIIGFASIVVLLPVPGYLASKMQTIQRQKMQRTDARVETITETVGVLRMIKLFGWEQNMSDRIKEKREEELSWIWKDKMINLANDMINFIIPTITMLVTYGTYTLIMGESLNASKVFSSMAVFDLVRNLLHRCSYMFAMIMRGKVSLDRINDFLHETELLDTYAEQLEKKDSLVQQSNHDGIIGFKDASFTWSKEDEDGTETPSSRSFRLKVEGELIFKRNAVNLIVGPTGCGKTSILMALLGEMHYIPTTMDSWYSLPRDTGVAYAAQESWVQNETIRDNILFGSPYDENRYQKVIEQCALKRDLEMFEAGDKTEVGEKGLTLSGGQKARVTLARAIYSSAEIILLDDILAALDVHTSKWIVEKCLKGDLIQGRTILLVTHNVALTAPIAEQFISVDPNGVAHVVGSDISDVLADPTLAHEVEQEEDEAQLEAEVIDIVKKEADQPDGKLILAEEIVEGRVTWKSLMLFFKGLGGERPAIFLFAWTLGIILMHGGNMLAVWFLGYWGSQYETHPAEEVDVMRYLSLYTSILLSSLITYFCAVTIYNIGAQRASRTISAQLISSVLSATLRWLDETPASRIIARCTQDIADVDSTIVQTFAAVVEIALCMLVKLSGPVILTPTFLIPALVVTVIGVYIGNVYLKAQMSVKREMSNARSPVLAHFGAAVAGLTSIRAYGAEAAFKKESLKRIDHLLKVSRTSFNLNRWVSIRIDLLGATLTASLASYLLVRKTLNAANVGFSLNMALDFCAMIIWLVRCYNEFEVQANSLERIQAYIDIEHEPKSTPAGKPPASWPTSGDLRVEKLSARYSQNGPKVLHDISFEVKAGERIGIVGRTGSGKSSLTLALLRCIITEGEVYYNDLLTSKLNLDELRSHITIIPQMPELLSGSLRRNLDPFEQHDDLTLNNALRAAGLFALQKDADEARLTLDSDISSGGNNLSVGQRQILALARAIVRNSKLLILDEATSAIDHKTDSIIQASLRNELGSDVTVLTVAHRLQTIMDADRIMVLDEGRIAEFDSPSALLQKQGSLFKALVDGSGDKKNLHALAERKGSSSSSD